jgi:hypothetical protein
MPDKPETQVSVYIKVRRLKPLFGKSATDLQAIYKLVIFVTIHYFIFPINFQGVNFFTFYIFSAYCTNYGGASGSIQRTGRRS